MESSCQDGAGHDIYTYFISLSWLWFTWRAAVKMELVMIFTLTLSVWARFLLFIYQCWHFSLACRTPVNGRWKLSDCLSCVFTLTLMRHYWLLPNIVVTVCLSVSPQHFHHQYSEQVSRPTSSHCPSCDGKVPLQQVLSFWTLKSFFFPVHF